MNEIANPEAKAFAQNLAAGDHHAVRADDEPFRQSSGRSRCFVLRQPHNHVLRRLSGERVFRHAGRHHLKVQSQARHQFFSAG